MEARDIREKTINALKGNRRIIDIEKMIVIAANDGHNKCYFKTRDESFLYKVAWYFSESGFKVNYDVMQNKLRISW